MSYNGLIELLRFLIKNRLSIMKILHLINLQGFGGAERLFIEYLKNSSCAPVTH